MIPKEWESIREKLKGKPPATGLYLTATERLFLERLDNKSVEIDKNSQASSSWSEDEFCTEMCDFINNQSYTPSIPIVSKDSVLRRVPQEIHTKLVLFLDGIRYSVQIIDLSFQRLTSILNKLSTSKPSEQEVGDLIVDAISNAWTIIDSGHRLRELIQNMPGLKKNTPEIQIFMRNTKGLEDLRHFVQHFRNGIDSFVGSKLPLWGTISWGVVDAEKGTYTSHTIAPGTFYNELQASGCTIDLYKFKFVEKIALTAGPKKVDLADIHHRVSDLFSWLDSFCDEECSWREAEKHHGSDVYFKIIITPKGNPNAPQGRDI